jgi:hypothetical protein
LTLARAVSLSADAVDAGFAAPVTVMAHVKSKTARESNDF